MLELNILIIKMLAISKILSFVFLIIIAILFFLKKVKPWLISILFATIIPAFYVIMSFPLKKMFWSNNGDEIFIISFLGKVLNGNMFHDFYYNSLPQFYPPLYFWITGLISRPFTSNAIYASKLGVTLILIAWFIIPIIIFYLFPKEKESNDKITSSPWLFIVYPIIFFVMLDFDAIITKPYEAFSALLCIIFIGYFLENINKKWRLKNYLVFAIFGAILFLTYYFWWFILFPAIIILSMLGKEKIKNLFKSSILCISILIFSSIYLVPLILSFIKYGMENWQAVFFVPADFYSFIPWYMLNLKTPILIIGILTLIIFYKKNSFIKAGAITLILCYLYQFLNIIYFVFGNKPLQSAKPFLFLGGATIAFGFSYFLIFLFEKIKEKYGDKKMKISILLVILFFLPLLPFNKFIEDPVVANHLQKDLQVPQEKELAQIVKNNVLDWEKRTWLSSGAPVINAYLPLNYYIAHNPHFSHQASHYSKRLDVVKKLSLSKNDSEFYTISKENNIDALLFYKNENYYNFFYWQDNYPNGGKEGQIKIPENLVSEKFWNKVYDNKDWYIFLRKD